MEIEDEEWRWTLILIGVLIVIILTLLPGIAIMRLVKYDGQSLNKVLYASGFGILFMLVVAIIANFTLGFHSLSLWVIYISSLAIILGLSWRYGRSLSLDWNWRNIALPLSIYIIACGLQLQTTLISPNLIGSDIHLEYFHANETLLYGYWNPDYIGGTINTCIGLTLLLPAYTLMSNLELIWVFKAISPIMFALLPLALYIIYKSQFGLAISLLATLFFVTTPMFTMDMVQLIRQQQSELFFILIILLILDESIDWKGKIIVFSLFSFGAITTHYGMSIGFIGYLLMGSCLVIILTKIYRHGKHRIDDAVRPILPRMIMVVMVVLAIGMYLGYYNMVNKGKVLLVMNIPVLVIERTLGTLNIHIPRAPEQPILTKVEKPKEKPKEVVEYLEEIDPAKRLDVEMIEEEIIGEKEKSRTIFEAVPALDPFLKEPLLQTAIGLDYGRASTLGKVWRILQYLVEICLVVGFLKFLFRPSKKTKIEYMSFVLASFFVVAGMFLLLTHSYGMGVTRVWQVTLLFMSPFFVIGAGTIGKGMVGWFVRDKVKIIVVSTLILFIPYSIFNSGIVYELAKIESVGFIDVPYSVALSSQRVDITTNFDKEDVEALNWLNNHIKITQDTHILFGDTHGARLLAQSFGMKMRGMIEIGDLIVVGNVRALRYMKSDDTGYIFLRKWNIDNNTLTFQAEYAGRISISLDNLPEIQDKINKGTVLFDNGAKIIFVE